MSAFPAGGEARGRELRLRATDPRVWGLTLEATEGDLGRPLKVRCRAGCTVARVGTTEGGAPLFASSWEVEAPAPGVVVNGQRLDRRHALRALDRIMPIVERSGPGTAVEVHGVVALLVLPAGHVEDFPDLLVRCKHGDAVVDRARVVEWWRAGRAPKVAVGFPLHDYARPSWDGARTTTGREVRHLGGPAVPLEELDGLLGREDTP